MNSWSYCGLPPEKKCAICGKKFCVRPEYRYTRGVEKAQKYFCSWHCMREYDKKWVHGGRKPNKAKDDILRLLNEGVEPKDIAEQLKIKLTMVYYYKDQYGGLDDEIPDGV